MIRFSFEVAGRVEFDRTFNRVSENVQDLRPVWEYAESAFYEIEREQFKSEGGKGGSGKWKKLSPAYEKWKTAKYPGQPILQRTGRLMESLTRETADTIVRKEKKEFAIGSNVLYGGFHQKGRNARPPISFSDAQRTQMQKAIQRGLVEILRKQGIGLTYRS